MPRLLLPCAVLLLLVVVAPQAARAEEVFVLDNGMVLRGSEVNRGADGVVIRLSDFASEARVTVAAARIVKRYDLREGAAAASSLPPMLFATDALPPRGPQEGAPPPFVGRPFAPLAVEAAPLEEPHPRLESFFARLQRLAGMALPGDAATRGVLALLALSVLFVLVLIGGQLLDVKGLSPGKALVLALAFGGSLAALAFWGDTLLRADRALWVLPALCAVLLGLGSWMLRRQLRSAVLLLGFLGFSVSVVGFAAGAVLMLC